MVIKLRKGVMFPAKPGVMEAREFVADDVVFAFTRLSTSPKKIAGYFDHVEKVEAVDKHTVAFTFKYFNAEWDYRFGWGYYSTITPKEVADAGATNWKNVNGTGPYMLTDFVQGSSNTYTKNPNYWDKVTIGGTEYKLPFVDKIGRQTPATGELGDPNKSLSGRAPERRVLVAVPLVERRGDRFVRLGESVDRIPIERIGDRQGLAQRRLQVQRRAGGDAARHLQRSGQQLVGRDDAVDEAVAQRRLRIQRPRREHHFHADGPGHLAEDALGSPVHSQHAAGGLGEREARLRHRDADIGGHDIGMIGIRLIKLVALAVAAII